MNTSQMSKQRALFLSSEIGRKTLPDFYGRMTELCSSETTPVSDRNCLACCTKQGQPFPSNAAERDYFCAYTEALQKTSTVFWEAVMCLQCLCSKWNLIRKTVILLYSRVVRQDMQRMNSLNPKGDHLPEILFQISMFTRGKKNSQAATVITAE